MLKNLQKEVKIMEILKRTSEPVIGRDIFLLDLQKKKSLGENVKEIIVEWGKIVCNQPVEMKWMKRRS